MTFVRSRRPQSTAARRPQPAARALFSLAVIGVFAWSLAAPARAQQAATVRRDGEPIFADPGGTLLGKMGAGVTVAPQARRDGDTQFQLDGWIFAASVQADRRQGHDLSVSPVEENLRASPNGRLVARLTRGALLDEVERSGGWVHVRRSVWIASDALGSAAAPAAAPGPTGPRPGPAAGDSGAGQGLDPRRAVLRHRVQLLSSPDSASTGVMEAGVPVRVTERANGWVRIQAQGWVPDSEVRPAGDQVVSGVTAADLRESPEEWKGKVLRWTIQFIALQTADELRSDFALGQKYILARGPAPEYAFVYIIVPPDKVDEVSRLRPLDSVTVLAVVKSGRSAYLANPILELRDIVP
jgi:hypothetical protein